MPLIRGWTERSVRRNVALEVRAGHERPQAVAIALRVAREVWRKKHPVGGFPGHLRKKKR